jgi:hypothetical protein
VGEYLGTYIYICIYMDKFCYDVQTFYYEGKFRANTAVAYVVVLDGK